MRKTAGWVAIATLVGAGVVAGASAQRSQELVPVVATTGTLSVVIEGPYIDMDDNAHVAPNQTCTYSANVSGGTSPYSYQWAQNFSPTGTGSSENVNVGTSAIQLRVTVTDANSDEAFDVIKILPDEPFNSC